MIQQGKLGPILVSGFAYMVILPTQLQLSCIKIHFKAMMGRNLPFLIILALRIAHTNEESGFLLQCTVFKV